MTIDTRDKTHDFKFRELADHMLTHNSTGDLDGDFAHAFITLMGAANARAQAAGDAAKGEDADTANADPRVILRVLIDYYSAASSNGLVRSTTSRILKRRRQRPASESLYRA